MPRDELWLAAVLWGAMIVVTGFIGYMGYVHMDDMPLKWGIVSGYVLLEVAFIVVFWKQVVCEFLKGKR